MLPRAAQPSRPATPTGAESLPLTRARALLMSALAVVGLVLGSSTSRAQTVVEVQGGGSSLTGGYGAAANFWRKRSGASGARGAEVGFRTVMN